MSSDHAGKPNGEKVCYVVMGFGKKTDFETGRTLDLDKTYKNIIKPAVEEAGLKCVRADEIFHSGAIDIPTYELLLKADVVIADLSTSNKNAFYDLGVRHALRPYTTIVISEEGMKVFPFDMHHVLIRQYHHMGEGINFDEVIRFRQVLVDALKAALSRPEIDSPVYTFLNQLKPPSLGEGGAPATVPPRSQARRPPPPPIKAATTAPPPEPSPQYKKLVGLIEQLEGAVKDGQFNEAGALFADALEVLQDNQDDSTIKSSPNLTQRMVQAASQVEGPTRPETLSGARRLLLTAGAGDSNDPETLQLLGDIEITLFNETRQVNLLLRARQTYERLHAIRRTYRSGITLASIITLHAEHQREVSDKISDITAANRLRKEVVEIGKTKLASIGERYRTEARLQTGKGSPAALKVAEAEEKLEVWGAIAEAYYSLADKDNYGWALDEAQLLQGANKMLQALEARIKQFAPVWERQAALLSSVENLIQTPTPAPAVSLTAPAPSLAKEAESSTPEEEPPRVRDLIFFSYSHNGRDKEILEEIQKTLAPLFQDQTIQMWDDGHIEPGQDWEKEIKQALARAKGAVLIVSRDFLNSTFISKEELPVILQAVEEEGIKLMWIAAEKSFVTKKISKYQALHNPGETLDSFSGKALNDKIFEICEKIGKLIFPDAS
jgi:hypothetical protein